MEDFEPLQRVSGKPHRKMPERTAILKDFHMVGEVSGNLMIYARQEALLFVFNSGSKLEEITVRSRSIPCLPVHRFGS